MIALSLSNGQQIFQAPTAIASVQEAGPSSAWHGIRAYVRTFDSRTYEVRETAAKVVAAIAEINGRSGNE